MIHIGIDPGKSGSLCLLDSNKDITFYDWPKDGDISSYFSKIQEDLEDSYQYISLAILEKVHAMPKQGVTSMFNFGENLGMWKAFLILTKIPHLIVPPQQWMKGLVTKSDGQDTKSAVKNVATRLFPKAELFGTKGGYKDGRGDALLMAYYASQQR
jgi:crossover junction endodeoxyribonuclease RuvC